MRKLLLQKGNKGFSLVELIVVILIAAILATGGIMSLSAVYYADEERAAKEICSLMQIARAKALALNDSSDSVSLKVFLADDGNYYAGVYQGSTLISPQEGNTPSIPNEPIAKYRVAVYTGKAGSYTDPKTKAKLLEDSGDCIEYVFRKSTGGIQSFQGKTGGTALSSGDDYVDLILTGAGQTSIVIVKETGRCYLR